MGLFSSILKIGSSIISGNKAKKASKKAQAAQIAAINSGMGEINNDFTASSARFQPYQEAGDTGIAALMQLLGLSGSGPQAEAIGGLKASPQFESLYRTGEEAVLANGSATGGLRGGNIQSSLANFGSDTLAKLIEAQIGRLGGLGSLGAQTAEAQGNLGANKALAISKLFGQQGDTTAGGILQRSAITSNTINSVAGEVGGIADKIGSAFSPGGGGIKALF